MRTAIVSSRQLEVFGRWDAGFNIWAYEMISGLQQGKTESFWIWFNQANLKRAELERVLVESTNLGDAVLAFERYMHVRHVTGIKDLIPGWRTELVKFVRQLTDDLIAKKQAEVDLAVNEIQVLKTKFKHAKVRQRPV